MCRFTYTFYECGHRTEDNVRGCNHYKRDGIHCDIDNPEIKRTRCELDLQNRLGFCPRCVHLEQMRADEAALKKDLEKAKLFDAEEQERNRQAHEAHLRKVRRESYQQFQSQEDQTLARVRKENKERAQQNNTNREADMVESSSSTPPPPPPLPTTATATATTTASASASAHSRSSATTVEHAAPPPPPLPSHGAVPNFPPPNYSQPPKDQTYGRFKIGTRHQPIHPSQDLPETPATPATQLHPQEPAPSARLASTVAPESPAPAGFAIPTGDQRSRLRSTQVEKSSPLGTSPPSTQEQPLNELEALWNKRGIQREADEDEGYNSGCSITPSQSASQIASSPSSGTACGNSTSQGESAEPPSVIIKTVSSIDQKRRTGWRGE
ncbi:hypothetical protein DM02DRAFT_670761 [Periconia macrospinosa]|uniref:Uncharacterized protein n=1 Tax=Periconia macrospinosa TaxID=97972 RepID=A0A2V1DV27_9PLEO|nr:hypothetical protein DM02DRAFT_670761 [Periconia macrospinosa]